MPSKTTWRPRIICLRKGARCGRKERKRTAGEGRVSQGHEQQVEELDHLCHRPAAFRKLIFMGYGRKGLTEPGDRGQDPGLAFMADSLKDQSEGLLRPSCTHAGISLPHSAQSGIYLLGLLVTLCVMLHRTSERARFWRFWAPRLGSPARNFFAALRSSICRAKFDYGSCSEIWWSFGEELLRKLTNLICKSLT